MSIEINKLLLTNPQKPHLFYAIDKSKPLGFGGFGQVFPGAICLNAANIGNSSVVEQVAVKIVKNSDQRFKREPEILKRLKHPNIIGYRDSFGAYEGAHAIVMEKAGGTRLIDYMDEEKGKNLLTITGIFAKIVAAVKYLHENGFAHRDLSPNNIMIDAASDNTIKLVDFGLSRELPIDGSLVHSPGGTRELMAPEVIEVPKTGYDAKKSDIWSLGVTFYWIITGEFPALDEEVELPDDFSEYKTLLGAMRKKNPNERITADQLAVEIETILKGIYKGQDYDKGRFYNLPEGRLYDVSNQPLAEKGSFSAAYPATLFLKDPNSGDSIVSQVVFKVIEANLHPTNQRLVSREPGVLKRLKHPNILEFIDSFKIEENGVSKVVVVTQRIFGEDLFDYTDRNLDPQTVMQIFAQIVSAVKYLHENGFVHRDLKLENIMVESATNSNIPTIKIIDFGFARELPKDGSPVKTQCGSIDYMAPELLQKKGMKAYDPKKVDVWSLGVILYVMLTNNMPYNHDSRPKLIQMIRSKKNLKIPQEISDYQELLLAMMEKDPNKRITAAEVANRIAPFLPSQSDESKSN